MASLEERLVAYIQHRLPEAGGVRVEGLERIFGGASRETYRFVLVYDETSRPLILRRDPPGSLIETERAIEFGAYRAFHGTSVPVPEPVWLEEDMQWLDHPFFIMEQLTGLGLQVELGQRRVADVAPETIATGNRGQLGQQAALAVTDHHRTRQRGIGSVGIELCHDP